jgi:hypothetical protein
MAENKKNQTPKNWRKPEEKPQRLADRPGPKLPSPALGWVLSEKCRRLLRELHRPIVRRLLSPDLTSGSRASPRSGSPSSFNQTKISLANRETTKVGYPSPSPGDCLMSSVSMSFAANQSTRRRKGTAAICTINLWKLLFWVLGRVKYSVLTLLDLQFF